VPGDKIYHGQGLELSFIFCSMYLMLGESAPRIAAPFPPDIGAGWRPEQFGAVGSLISKVDLSLGETCENWKRTGIEDRNRARLCRQTEKIRSFFSSAHPHPLLPFPSRGGKIRSRSGATRRQSF